MTQTPPPDDSRDALDQFDQLDKLDGLLADFFKAQMKKPWPAAPETHPMSTPASANTGTAPETPRNQPAAARRDSGSKARYTLAASVALLLGTCWYLSNGFQPGDRPSDGTGPDRLNKTTAGPGDSKGPPDLLQGIKEANAKHGEQGITPPVIDKLP